jgi:hypothetical protein
VNQASRGDAQASNADGINNFDQEERDYNNILIVLSSANPDNSRHNVIKFF